MFSVLNLLIYSYRLQVAHLLKILFTSDFLSRVLEISRLLFKNACVDVFQFVIQFDCPAVNGRNITDSGIITVTLLVHLSRISPTLHIQGVWKNSGRIWQGNGGDETFGHMVRIEILGNQVVMHFFWNAFSADSRIIDPFEEISHFDGFPDGLTQTLIVQLIVAHFNLALFGSVEGLPLPHPQTLRLLLLKQIHLVVIFRNVVCCHALIQVFLLSFDHQTAVVELIITVGSSNSLVQLFLRLRRRTVNDLGTDDLRHRQRHLGRIGLQRQIRLSMQPRFRSGDCHHLRIIHFIQFK